MKRKPLILTILIFAFFLFGSIVYAATTGLLNFGGTAAVNPNVDLDIVDAFIVNERPSENITITNSNNTMNFNVLLVEPGETKTIKFKIQNMGNTDVELGNLITNNPPTESGITVVWPNLDELVVLQESTSAEFTITVIWEATATDAPSGNVSFNASINYQQVQ